MTPSDLTKQEQNDLSKDINTPLELPEEQQNYLDRLLNRLHFRTKKKFTVGVFKYGSKIWEIHPLALIEEAENEAIDQFTYIDALRLAVTKLLAENEKLIRENDKLKAKLGGTK